MQDFSDLLKKGDRLCIYAEILFRRFTKKHVHLFFVLVLVGLIAGCLTAYFELEFWFSLASIGLTATGFMFTVYGLVQPLERIDSIPGVLKGAIEILEEVKRNEVRKTTIICEYPLFGCLSQFDTTLYEEYSGLLANFYNSELTSLHGKLRLAIAENIEDRINNYGMYMLRSRKNGDKIVSKEMIKKRSEANTILIRRLREYQEVKEFPSAKHPRFQAIFTERRALIFLELKTLEQGESDSTSYKIDSLDKIAASKEKIEVPILGWDINDPKVIQWLDDIWANTVS